MNRRQALTRVSLILGGTVAGAGLFLEGCKPAGKKAFTLDFTSDDVNYLDEIAETIIPTTDTPGAKAAGVGSFMTVMVRDCYTEQDQQIFTAGMGVLNDASTKKFGGAFLSLSPEQRHELLVEIDEEQKEYYRNKKTDEPAHYFRLMKELTLLGYFTSEIGSSQALRYIESPGRYESCIPYQAGEGAWAI